LYAALDESLQIRNAIGVRHGNAFFFPQLNLWF
jgi:hypothetical protein